MSRLLRFLLLGLALALLTLPAAGQSQSRLAEFLSTVAPPDIVPGADRFGPVEGQPPLAEAFAGQKLIGYVYVNSDWVNSTGYSGRPIQILVGLGLDGRITGARLMDHHEPIVLIGIPPERIKSFIDGYVGRNALEIAHAAPAARPPVDIVSGATVTVTVIADSIIRSAIRLARAKGLDSQASDKAAARLELDPAVDIAQDWQALLGDGSVRRLALSVGDVNAAFAKAGNSEAAAHPESPSPEASFVDLYVALASVPSIGRSLLGKDGYERLAQRLKPGQQAVLIAGEGAYSFKGSGYVRGGIFDRLEVIQGETSIRFRDRDHIRVGDLSAGGAPSLRDIDLFIVPEGVQLDPAQPWRLQLLAQRAWGARDKAFLTFDVAYQTPAKYLRAPAQPAPAPAAAQAAAPAPAPVTELGETPLWQTMWQAHPVQISVLIAALLVLTLIFFFQDWLAVRPLLYSRLRLAYLVFSLVWLGWYADAQLSVVNTLTFLSALRSDFRWDYFLMAPLIFILWFAVAASLLFWNRGAFCGWLCPFGAMQELLNRAARKIGIPQLAIPFGVHQRLVSLKYVIFLVLFGISLSALATAEQLAEVEPFKTAIILRFARSWPFVLYAAALLAANLTVERFFCRYLCPLGAALAIPARLRMFDWLRRYRECGNPCQRCAVECPVQAIHPEGHINPNECIQCLNCQVLYHHDQKCPVMITKRQKRERRQALASSPEAMAAALAKRPATVIRHLDKNDVKHDA
jgi:NosR/NirI family nitrous oxide reductase transcriptional regulator